MRLGRATAISSAGQSKVCSALQPNGLTGTIRAVMQTLEKLLSNAAKFQPWQVAIAVTVGSA